MQHRKGALGRREDDPECGRYPDVTALALAEGRVVMFRKYGPHARFEVLWLDNRPEEPAEPPMPGEANFAAVSIHGVVESAEARDGLKILFAFEGQEGGRILDLSKTEWIQNGIWVDAGDEGLVYSWKADGRAICLYFPFARLEGRLPVGRRKDALRERPLVVERQSLLAFPGIAHSHLGAAKGQTVGFYCGEERKASSAM